MDLASLLTSGTFWTAIGSVATIIGVIITIRLSKAPLNNNPSSESEKNALPDFDDGSNIPNSDVSYEVVDSLKPLNGCKFVFCYGSLLVPESLLETIMRSSEKVEYLPATLKGHQLSWGAPSRKINLVNEEFLPIASERKWLSLVATPNSLSEVNGAIIRVSEREFSEIVLRESHYSPTKLNHLDFSSSGKLPEDSVWYFEPSIANEDNEKHKKNISYYVRKGYFENVGKMLKKLGFEKSLPDPPQNSMIIDAFIPDTLFSNKIIINDLNIGEYYNALLQSLDRYTSINGVKYEINTGTRPVLITEAMYQEVKEKAEIAVSLCARALDGVMSDDQLLKKLKFREEDIKLIKSNQVGNSSLPTIARVDMTLFKERVHIFEVNGDSPGGMFHTDFLNKEHSRFYSLKESFPKCVDFTKTQNICISIRNEIRDLYSKNKGVKNTINVAILEISPKSWNTYPEFKYFEDEVSNDDINFFICEPKEIIVGDDGLLYHNGELIDVVYKRALIKDLEKEEHIAYFRKISESFARNDVLCVNSVKSRFSGSKSLLAMLGDSNFVDKYLDGLTEKERNVIDESIPKSMLWNENVPATQKSMVLKNINAYVLKSNDGYGGGDVFLGENTAAKTQRFEEALSNRDCGFIIQKKTPHGRVLMPLIEHGEVKWRYMYCILGAYIINGRCIAIEAKYAPTPKVNLKRGFRTIVMPCAQ